MRREFSPDVRLAALQRAYYRCERCESRKDLELHHKRQCRRLLGLQCGSPVPVLLCG
jgi:hypothetical protein